MGWASGAELADALFDYVEIAVKDDDLRKMMALKFVETFERFDCDTMYECQFVETYLTWNDDKERWEFK